MKYVIILGLLVLAGCTSVDVRPIPASAKLDKVCIQFNNEVNVEDFVPVMQEGFFNHGISSVVFHSERPKGCEFTMTYAVDRWWDLAPYMVDARMTVNKDDSFIGKNATVLDGAVVESGAMVAAGAVVMPHKVVRGGELWAGKPAQKLRDLTEKDFESFRRVVAHYVELARAYRVDISKAAE